MSTESGYCPLDDYGLLRVSGADAGALLQGQSTCDVHATETGKAACGAFCTPKGRVIANFRVLRQENDCFYLWLARNLAEKVCKRLRMYVLLSQVTIEDLSETYDLFGVFGDLPQDAGNTIALGIGDTPKRTMVAFDQANSDTLKRMAVNMQALPIDAWRLADIAAGWPLVTAVTSEEFIPQMINLDLLGGISFNKGCYTGQEIVTRTKFLGEVKRRMYRLAGNTPRLPSPGDRITISDSQEGSPVGQVVNACSNQSGDGFEILVVLSVDQADSTEWMILDRETHIHLERLPLPVQ